MEEERHNIELTNWINVDIDYLSELQKQVLEYKKIINNTFDYINELEQNDYLEEFNVYNIHPYEMKILKDKISDKCCKYGKIIKPEDKKINRVERKARNLTNQYIKDKLNEIIDKVNGKDNE